MIKHLAFVVLVSCGQPIAIEPPTTATACDRALECGAVSDAELCVACIERSGVAPKWNARLRELYGDNPPTLEETACEIFVAIAERTNLKKCVAEDWFRVRERPAGLEPATRGVETRRSAD